MKKQRRDIAFTDFRGFLPDGSTIDGRDGWPWVAWSGPYLVHGSTEAHALERLRHAIDTGSCKREPHLLSVL